MIIYRRIERHMIHMNVANYTLTFEVYPIIEWEKDGKMGFSYVSKKDEPDLIDEFKEDECVKKFEGSYCWRGIWEGRLYFTDDEYWEGELSEMAELYENHIVPQCKEFIKLREPLIDYDE